MRLPDTVAEGNVISQDVQGRYDGFLRYAGTADGERHSTPASDTDTIPVPDVLGALEAGCDRNADQKRIYRDESGRLLRYD